MSDAPETDLPDETLSSVYISSFTIANFRCFDDEQSINFTDSSGRPHMWNIILGENGVGKTSILILLCDSVMRCKVKIRGNNSMGMDPQLSNWVFSGFKTSEILDGDSSKIMYYLIDNYRSGIDVCYSAYSTGFILDNGIEDRFINALFKEYNVNILPGDIAKEIFGIGFAEYSASRLMDDKSISSQDRDNISLLNPLSPLVNAEDWLVQADYAVLRKPDDQAAKKRFELVKSILRDLLPDVEDYRFQTAGNSTMIPVVEAKTSYGWVRVRELSLGYQTTIAWIVDFASRLMEKYPDSENPFAEPAICLVDEIDLHMHPRWQKELVQKLRRIFPKTQFIVTAHSPLIVQADPEANIALLRREGDHVVIDNDVDHIKNWRVEQILASELFAGAGEDYRDLVNPPHVAKLLDRRREILGQAELSESDRVELRNIDDELENLPTTERPEDQKALDLIRNAAGRIGSDLK